VWEAEWAPRPVWTGEENLVPTRIRTPGRPAGSELLTDYAIPAQDGEVINGHISRLMRFSCLVTKARDRYLEYVILFTFPRQHLSSKRASLLRYTYTVCLVMMKTDCFIYHVPCEAEEKVDDLSNMTEHAGLKK
jgi:hypothetical protein